MEELNRAIFEENLIEANRILEVGCNLDAADSTGKTPLMQAVLQEDARFIELLITYGASINASGFNGWTPLHIAVDISIDGTIQSNGKQGTEPTSIIELLIKFGADLDQVTNEGDTPMDIAKKYNNKKITEYLLNAKP
jgi:ankyrin repeat protein